MTNRWVTCTLAILTLLLAWGFLSSAAPAEADESIKGDSKIDERVLADTEGGRSAHFIVVLAEQANLDSALGLKTKEEKGAFVTQQLREVAARTQPAVIKELDALGVKYRAYWVTNMFAVQGDRSVVEALAKLPAVARIEPDRVITLEKEPVLTPEDALPPTEQLAVEWGLTKIGAPSVWSLGYTGQNIVIANQDTGMQWDHPALKAKYRGWNGTTANHNYNWWDAIHSTLSSGSNPCGLSTTAPCDDDQHGTHTTGTTVGEGGTNQIGVAPGARWIGCRNMERGSGRPSTYTECFQFFLAPTDLSGNNANPSLAPHIINNSWGCPHGAPPSGEDCVVNSFKTVVENLRAAGIMVVVSNGNEGSSCSTTGAPPAYLDAATSVGATDSSDNIASFSSRGPVTADGSSRIKPDISAPGVSVRSAVPGNGYASLSGTSMAGPHVAGAVALLWSARPELIGNIDATEQLLFNTAVPRTTTQNCGGVSGSSIPNNTYGYGRMDILAAVNSGTGPTPTPTNTPGPSTCTTFASTDVPKSISASGTPSVASILTISGSGTITDLNLKNLNGTHTWINDLDFTLQSPGGTSVQVMARSCSSQDNFNLNLDDEAAAGAWPCPPVGGGTYRPSNLLSTFDGQNANGTWTLTVRDNVSSDGGSLNGWSLEVCTAGGGGPTPTPTNTPTPTPTQPPVVNTGFLSPSANAAVTTSSGDNNGFEGTAANAYSDNATFATDTNSGTSTATTCTSTAKDKHLYYNYNFAIPGSATIRGVEIRLDGRADSTASSPRFCVQLSWDGGTTWTTAKTSANLTTTEATYILGTATDTWGRTWTPANFANTSLRVRIIPIASSTARDFYLDWVAARVSYQ